MDDQRPVGFAQGFFAFFQGLGLLHREKLWGYVVLPAIVGILAWLGVLYLIIHQTGEFFTYLVGYFFQIESDFLDGILWVLAIIAGGLLSFILFRVIAGIIIIPFLGPLLARVESILIGESIEVTFARDMKNIFLGVVLSFQFAVMGILIWFFSLFLGPLQVAVIALAESYFLGREALDPILEKETRNLKARREKAHRMFTSLMGLGFAFFLFLWIPVIGVFLAPAAAIAGAAILRHQKRSIPPTGKNEVSKESSKESVNP